ncbi:MAG: ABC transporter permease, partial [candidate division NC10 bacterium]|nr:ABC transporter permease [candidate division NC10 bacterium]
MDRPPHPVRGQAVANGHEEPGAVPSVAEERISVATQWQLMWWRFRKHRVAMVSTVVVFLFYLVVIFADFLAYSNPLASEAQRSLLPPQPIHWFDGGRLSPHVYGLAGRRDPVTFKRVYTPDPEKKIPVRFFAKGFEYHLFGLIPANRHFIGVEGAPAEETLFVLGTDEQGRDLWSRLMYGTQISLIIGLVGVAMSLILGIFLG